MRYAIVAAAFIASVAAVPFSRPGGSQGGRPDWDDDCEVSWVTVDPEPASSTEVIVDPVPTTSAVTVEPVDTSAAETTTKRRIHGHGGHHTGRPTGRPTVQPTTTPKTSTKKTSTKTKKPTTAPTTKTTPVPTTTAVPTTTKPTTTEQSPEPTTNAGETPFPYPSPSPTQFTWADASVNSAEHSTSYTDPATATVEPQCTAAASDYSKAAVDGHNAKRAEHQANPVVWDENLSCIAQRQAASCLFDHLMYVNGGGYGQNLAGGTGTTISDSIEMWYGEASDYDQYYGQSDPPFVAGHFTQMVWASTTSIGCATHTCDGSTGSFTGELTVCNYYVFGNMAGAYKENVLPSTGNSTSDGW